MSIPEMEGRAVFVRHTAGAEDSRAPVHALVYYDTVFRVNSVRLGRQLIRGCCEGWQRC